MIIRRLLDLFRPRVPTVPIIRPAPVPGPPPTSTAVPSLVNGRRVPQGFPPLADDPALISAAADHAMDLAARGVLSHYGRDGSTWQDRAARRGYRGTVGEVIAAGQRSADQAVADWMNSPGHRAILLDPRATRIGVAVAGTYWVALVGR